MASNTPATPGQGLSLEPIQGNSLTEFIRSIEGLTGKQGQQILGSGLAQEQSGVNSVAPVLSLLTKLVSGDQADITQATQPEIDQITQQFDQVRNLVSMQPRGGGKTTALAEAPFQKAGQIQRMQGDMRTKAAGELGTLGTNLAGLGLNEAGLGANLESESANIALTKEGQDYSQPSLLDQIAQGIDVGNAGVSFIKSLFKGNSGGDSGDG